jgi:hypothetical protein
MEAIAMKVSRLLSIPLLLLAAACAAALPVAAARADTLLYDGLSVISGQQAAVQSFNISTPGTLTVTLSDLPWLDTVTGLSAFLSTASGMVGTSFGAGTESFDVAAGTYYAHWFGTASGSYNLGVVGMQISFQPSNVTAVPLPSSLALMLGGLGILFGWQSRRPATSLRVTIG